VRFTYAESMCEPSQYFTLAVEAERAGFDSFTVPDSIAYPEISDSKYPYTPDGDRSFLAGRPFIDPFALIAALGAVTDRLRFTTFVVKLPVRQPVLVAKQVASVAVLTRNRLALGVGLSPWPEDYAMCGVPWKGRGRRMDEMIEIVRGLTDPSGRFFEFHGEHFDIPSLKLCPVPSEPIPILIGGHAEAALRRAARAADGWMHAGGGQAQDLAGALRQLAELRREYGREREPFEIHVISLDAYTVDGIRRLEDQGVTDAIVGFRNAYEADTTPLQRKVDALRAYADAVIAKV
jgi:probable F420-dependent oxidoreductase